MRIGHGYDVHRLVGHSYLAVLRSTTRLDFWDIRMRMYCSTR